MRLQVSGDLVLAETPPTASSTLKPCGDLVTGQEALLPIPEDQVSRVQHLGETACTLGGFDYQLMPIGSTGPNQ